MPEPETTLGTLATAMRMGFADIKEDLVRIDNRLAAMNGNIAAHATRLTQIEGQAERGRDYMASVKINLKDVAALRERDHEAKIAAQGQTIADQRALILKIVGAALGSGGVAGGTVWGITRMLGGG